MGVNAKPLVFICCSPAEYYNCAETGNALDFVECCKDAANNSGSNSELGQVKTLKAELSRLKLERGDQED